MMTLAAGILAFAAVQLQMRDQRRTLREKQETQKRAIATGILYEIDSFFLLELEGVEKTLSLWDAASDPLPSSAFIRQNSFEIYRANSLLLGSLNPKSVSAIVKFYTMAGTYEALAREYEHFLDRVYSGVNAKEFEKCARQRLKMLRDLIPQMKELTTNVSKAVAEDCGLNELVDKDDAQAH